MAKITMQDIADALGISRVTVWKVLNQQSGVSEPLRNQILQKAEELGYPKLMPVITFPESPRILQKTVSIIVSRPDSSVFWMNIIHRIAKELSKYNVDLIYSYVPAVCPEHYTLPASLTNGTVQGCIILNVYDAKMVRLINTLEIPKVFLDTVTEIPGNELTGDLYLLEGIDTMRTLTSAMIRKGYTRLGFVGDIAYARTNADRYQGFCMAMEENHLEIKKQDCLTKRLDIYSYEELLHQFLYGLETLPDGFICVSDYVAHFMQIYFTEHQIRVPEDIFLTGYDNNSEYSNLSNLSATVDVDTVLLGKRLARQILFRIDNPSRSKEVIYMTSQILYRKE